MQIQEQLNSVYKTHIFMYDISITYSYFTKLGNCPRKRRHLSHKTTSLCCNIYFLVTTYRRHTVITAIIMVMVNFLSSFPQSSQGVHYNTCIPFSLGWSTILMLLLMTTRINVHCSVSNLWIFCTDNANANKQWTNVQSICSQKYIYENLRSFASFTKGLNDIRW